MLMLVTALLHDPTDLHHAGNVSVMALVGDEFCCGGSESALEIGQGMEAKMADGVIRAQALQEADCQCHARFLSEQGRGR
jgi:hypothetical protein